MPRFAVYTRMGETWVHYTTHESQARAMDVARELQRSGVVVKVFSLVEVPIV